MGIVLIIALGGLIAQGRGELHELKPYTMKLKGQPEPIHVLVDESELNDRNKFSLSLKYDEPWNPPREELHQRIEIESYVDEAPAVQANRIRQGWLAHDGVEVSDRAGKMIWVPRREKELLDRAKALAAANRRNESVYTEAAASMPEGQSHPGPGFVQLWWPHAAIAAGSIALAAGVFVLLLRRQEQWQALEPGNQGPRRR